MGFKTIVSSLLRKPEPSPAKADPKPAPKPQFAAVSIKPGRPACEAARAAQERRILSARVPKLPLTECTMAADCKCAFVKHPDRRDLDDRRMFGWDGTTQDWYGENNRRKSRGRRTDDI
ncbi:MAG TPA: hypothetical protein VLT59_05125 [Steroidobacteraceae bacterium]|nr:hypothetical protein [Steroidobacteraceae bacterium]